jgi:molybdopterin-guanine dinucleotide biosynthesis protein A
MIAGLVLAGGAGRRFGGAEKALLGLGGRPLLAHVLARLRPQLGLIAISGREGLRPWVGDCPILDDGEFTGAGPLAGLLAGLEWAAGLAAEALLSVPVDTPFIPLDLAARLAPAPACAGSAGRAHHLVGMWPVSAAPVLRAMLAAPGPRAVAALVDRLGCQTVVFDTVPDPFLNVNRPVDLAAAVARLG